MVNILKLKCFATSSFFDTIFLMFYHDIVDAVYVRIVDTSTINQCHGVKKYVYHYFTIPHHCLDTIVTEYSQPDWCVKMWLFRKSLKETFKKFVLIRSIFIILTVRWKCSEDTDAWHYYTVKNRVWVAQNPISNGSRSQIIIFFVRKGNNKVQISHKTLSFCVMDLGFPIFSCSVCIRIEMTMVKELNIEKRNWWWW